LPHCNQHPSVWSQSLLDHCLEHADTFHYKDLLGHYGCVNSFEFSPDGNYLVSGGDDRRVLLWNLWDAISGLRASLPPRSTDLITSSFSSQIPITSLRR